MQTRRVKRWDEVAGLIDGASPHPCSVQQAVPPCIVASRLSPIAHAGSEVAKHGTFGHFWPETKHLVRCWSLLTASWWSLTASHSVFELCIDIDGCQVPSCLYAFSRAHCSAGHFVSVTATHAVQRQTACTLPPKDTRESASSPNTICCQLLVIAANASPVPIVFWRRLSMRAPQGTSQATVPQPGPVVVLIGGEADCGVDSEDERDYYGIGLVSARQNFGFEGID